MENRAGVGRMKPSQHWTRIVMYEQTSLLLRNLRTMPPVDTMTVVEIAPSEDSYWETFGFGKYYETPGFPEFDICADPMHGLFDLIILDNVLEHVVHPKAALQNVVAHLLPGGHFLVVTPFLIRVHPSPRDLWRWTEDGLRTMLYGLGLRTVETGAWGNRECVLNNLNHWAAYRPGLSLENNPECPVMVWALAGI